MTSSSASSPSAIQSLLSASGLRVLSSCTLQSLWAGYGKAMEVSAQREEDGKKVSVIIKHVTPPRGSKEDDDVGNQRKLKSYQVEATFYREVAPLLRQRTSSPAIAESLSVETDASTGSATLVLIDLRTDFPCSKANGLSTPGRSSSQDTLDLDHTLAALTWLAQLHAAFFNLFTLPEGLWEEGCYWHLATRLEELDAVRREWPELAEAASLIDRLLRGTNGGKAPRTLLHGDAKSANFLFSSSGSKGNGGKKKKKKENGEEERKEVEVVAAAYDFQYTGGGDGMKDVAYLLCSSTQANLLPAQEERLLRHYHSTLTSLLSSEDAVDYTYEVMVERFELAILDYVRWMCGWGFWGNSAWAKRKAKATLQKILSER